MTAETVAVYHDKEIMKNLCEILQKQNDEWVYPMDYPKRHLYMVATDQAFWVESCESGHEDGQPDYLLRYGDRDDFFAECDDPEHNRRYPVQEEFWTMKEVPRSGLEC